MKLFLVFALAFVALAVPLPPWPYASEESCNNRSESNREIIAPRLLDWGILNADPNGATDLDKRDRLFLNWTIHTSYTLLKIWGDDVNTYVAVTNETTSNGNDGSARITFGNSQDCWGTVQLEIFLGSLRVWGFEGVQEPGMFNITGGLWINTSRPINVTDELETLQEVTVIFPINIKVNSIYNIQLGTNLTVYGTSKVSGSIILFKEHEWPSRDVTIYYLLSVQYPYRFTNGTNSRGLSLPRSSVDPTVGGTLLLNEIVATSSSELWYYATNENPGAYCKSSADSTANWCYQVVHVEYHIVPTCDLKNNVLKFNGRYELDLAITCRDSLLPGWSCIVPNQDWAYPVLYFTVSSNNICEKFLTYDGQITGHIDIYNKFTALVTPPSTVNASLWDHVTQTTFVPDNLVWFVLDLSHSTSFAIKMTKVTVLNITFWKENTNPPEALIWTGSWSGPALAQLYPNMYCNNDDTAACKDLDNNPTAFWSLLLNHSSYLDLTGKYSMKLLCVAYIQITYAWLTGERTIIMATEAGKANIVPTAEFFIGGQFDDAIITPIPSSAIAASSASGMIIGIAVGAAALCAAVGALVLFKVRSKKGGFEQTADTTA